MFVYIGEKFHLFLDLSGEELHLPEPPLTLQRTLLTQVLLKPVPDVRILVSRKALPESTKTTV